MEHARVVTVDQVEAHEFNSTLVSSKGETVEQKSSASSASFQDLASASGASGEGQEDGQDVDAASENTEAMDKLYPLPENWPKIKQLKIRPRSCELSNIRTPCVRKAVSHIELIQNIIDEWFKRVSAEAKSRASSSRSTVKAPTVQKHLRFQDDLVDKALSTRESPSYKPSSASRLSSSRLSSASTQLSIAGKGATVDEGKEESEVDEIPFLGAQDVIDEVLILLARLECERHDAHNKHIEELKRSESLRGKIDELELRKLRELPALVQREHEACINDVNELHWHVSYASRNEAKAQNRFTVAQRLNNQLKEDITFVKQHVPLVQEKLVLEVEAMDKIRKAQGETDQELVMTKQRQAKTEMKSTEALTKAETERGHIKKELDTVRDNLTVINEELTEAKMTYNAFVHQVNDIYQQLTDNEQELKVLRVKNENARTAEEMQATKVRDLQSKITQAEFDYRQLESQNEQLQLKLDMNRKRYNHKLQDLSKHFKALEGKYRIIQRKNHELSVEIEDCEEKIAKCERQKIADEKNINRINREIERTATMLHHTMEEHHRISTINHHIRDQLQSEQDKAYRTEETLKQTAETLRRQVKDEIHTRTVLQARINSDAAEIEKVKGDSAKKKGKAKSVADDVEHAVTGVLDKVEKLRNAKEEKKKKIENLQVQIAETEKQHQESSDRFQETLSRIEPQHNLLKGQLADLTKRIDHMDWRTELMNNKIEEMNAAQGMMERSVSNSEKAIAVLSAELDEVNIQLEAGRKIEEDLRKQYNDTIERLRNNGNKHGKLQKDRQEVFKKHETDKVRFMERNKELASKYRQLQNDYVICKEQMLRSYEERVKFEAAITDVKQLKSLQSKMHGALAEYFKLSGLYNEAELSKLEHASSVNGVRVSELQVNMETALEDISQFLSSQMDGKLARQMAWDAVKRKSVITGPPELSTLNMQKDSTQIPPASRGNVSKVSRGLESRQLTETFA